ncbi:MAG: amino acid ABC transporter permease [Pseudorhodobacter sp.]
MFEDSLRLFTRYQDIYFQGLANTLEAAAIGLVLALIVGGFAGVIRFSSQGPIGYLVAAYVSIVRNTPMMVQVYFIYFGLPALGIRMSAFETGLVALTFNSGAYIAEIVRGGLAAIPKGQMEASHALGLRRSTALRRVLLPQAVPLVLPAITGQFVQLIKDTSLLYTISVLELTQAANEVGNETYSFLEAYMVSWVLYLVVCIILNILVDFYEKRSGFTRHLRA